MQEVEIEGSQFEVSPGKKKISETLSQKQVRHGGYVGVISRRIIVRGQPRQTV
jgi:hypothetical protein